MAQWKKIVVSGSGVAQLANDANYLVDGQAAAQLSGSFSGSFQGDGSNLTGLVTSLSFSGNSGTDSIDLKTESLTLSGDGAGITTSVDAGTNTISLVSNGIVSSSAQLASAISGAFGADSASFSGRVSTLESEINALGDTYATDAELNASSSAILSEVDIISGALAGGVASNASDISALQTDSASFSGRVSTAEGEIDALQADSASFSTRVATNEGDISGLISDSASFESRISSNDSEIAALQVDSASLAGRVTSNEGDISDLFTASGSFSSRVTSNEGDISALQSDSASFESRISSNDSDIADLVLDSASFEGRITTNANDIATEKGRIDAILAASTADADSFKEIVDLINSVDTTNDAAFAGYVTASNGRFAALEAETGSIAADSASFSTRVSTLEGDLASLGDTYTTDVELNASSSALITAYTNADTALSTSLAAAIATNASDISSNDDDIFALQQDSASFSSRVATAEGEIDALQSDSASFSGRVSANEGDIAGLVLDSASLASRIVSNDGEIAALQTDSASFSGRVSTNEGDIAGLITDSGSFSSRVSSNETDVAALKVDSGSFSTRVSDLESELSTLGDTYTTDVELNASSSALISAYEGADTVLSGALAVDIAANKSGVANNDGRLDVLEAITFISSSAEGDAQGQIKLNGVNVDANGLGSDDSPTFANLTVTGDLQVSGTVTNVNTTDLNIEDKFILLNSGSASGNSGFIVQNSATNGVGTALFWDDTADRWALDIAGADAIADTATSDGYLAAVAKDNTDVNFQKSGNLYVDDATGEAFIWV